MQMIGSLMMRHVVHTVSVVLRVVTLLRLLRWSIILTHAVADERGDLGLGDIRDRSQREGPHMIMIVPVEHARDTDRTLVRVFGARRVVRAPGYIRCYGYGAAGA